MLLPALGVWPCESLAVGQTNVIQVEEIYSWSKNISSKKGNQSIVAIFNPVFFHFSALQCWNGRVQCSWRNQEDHEQHHTVCSCGIFCLNSLTIATKYSENEIKLKMWVLPFKKPLVGHGAKVVLSNLLLRCYFYQI